MAESVPLAILPKSMGQGRRGGAPPRRLDAREFLPETLGGLLIKDPKGEKSPYTFSDSPAYAQRKGSEAARTHSDLCGGKDETRGFLRLVEDFGRTQRWEEALKALDRHTTAPSGFFLLARAILRWKFGRFSHALADADEAMRLYRCSDGIGALTSAFISFAHICMGSQVRSHDACSHELRSLILAWEIAECRVLEARTLDQCLFRPQTAERLVAPQRLLVGEAIEVDVSDGTYVVASGVRVGYSFIRNITHAMAPVVILFHGCTETTADYRMSAEATERYASLPVHLIVVDYRGYGWSNGNPSLSTCLRDAELFAEKLGETFISHGIPWPYPGGLVLAGRSLGAHIAVHLASLYQHRFPALLLESPTSTTGISLNDLKKGVERQEAIACWQKDLSKFGLDILQQLAIDLRKVTDLEKIKAYEGTLLVLHGLSDTVAPYDVAESLHNAAVCAKRELVLIEGAGHNDLRSFPEYQKVLQGFLSKVQLAAPVESHQGSERSRDALCMVCSMPAASKCGRCQLVWYCSRQHQAEHWKIHKAGCCQMSTLQAKEEQVEGLLKAEAT